MSATAWLSKKLSSGKKLPPERIVELAIENGLKNIYVGQYVTNELDDNGICPHCGYSLEGIWD